MFPIKFSLKIKKSDILRYFLELIKPLMFKFPLNFLHFFLLSLILFLLFQTIFGQSQKVRIEKKEPFRLTFSEGTAPTNPLEIVGRKEECRYFPSFLYLYTYPSLSNPLFPLLELLSCNANINNSACANISSPFAPYLVISVRQNCNYLVKVGGALISKV